MVRRLRSIRFSSMPSTVRLRPPRGGTRRVAGSMLWVVMPMLLLRRRSPVRLRNASSRPRAVISRSWAGGLGQQVAGHGVGVLGVDVDRVTADLDALDSGEGGQRTRGVGTGQGGADRAAGRHGLDLAARAVGDDPALADQDDPVGVLVGLLEVVGRERAWCDPSRRPRGSRTRRRDGPRRPCPWSARRGAGGRGRRAAPWRSAGAAARRRSTCRPCGRRSPRCRRCASTSVDRVRCRRTGWRCRPTVSRTERSLSRPPVCMTAETSPRAMAWRGWRPRTSTEPVVGCDRPRTMSMVVVLPAPLGPRKATISPGSSERSMPRTAWTGPKSLVTPDRWTAGTVAPPGWPEAAGYEVCVWVMPRSSRRRSPGASHTHHDLAVTFVRDGRAGSGRRRCRCRWSRAGLRSAAWSTARDPTRGRVSASGTLTQRRWPVRRTSGTAPPTPSAPRPRACRR